MMHGYIPFVWGVLTVLLLGQTEASNRGQQGLNMYVVRCQTILLLCGVSNGRGIPVARGLRAVCARDLGHKTCPAPRSTGPCGMS